MQSTTGSTTDQRCGLLEMDRHAHGQKSRLVEVDGTLGSWYGRHCEIVKRCGEGVACYADRKPLRLSCVVLEL